jgi:Zn-dependent metalloprotease
MTRSRSAALCLAVACLLSLPATPAHAGPALSPVRLAALRAQEARRIEQAGSHLRALRADLDLQPGGDFTPHLSFTDPDGRAVVRFHQNHEGTRVWGADAIVHLEADGSAHAVTEGVQRGLRVSAGPLGIDAAAASALALRSLAPKGPLAAPPKVELVVFPTEHSGDFSRPAPAHGFGRAALRLPAPRARFVWAWEVTTLLANPWDGFAAPGLLIDAQTGAILRRWSGLQSAAAQGTGKSFYRGTVPLSTSLEDAGTYALVSTRHGTLPQPYVAAQGQTQIGLTTYYGYFDLVQGYGGYQPYQGHAGDTWGIVNPIPFSAGTGLQFEYNAARTMAWGRGALNPNGETTAVDAHFGLSSTWDFYKSVFGRDGIDDRGTSTLAIVHFFYGGSPLQSVPEVDNAYWSNDLFGMVFGDGSYPLDKNGMQALTEIDITGHELSHGVTAATAGLIYSGLSGGLNEANSDILGKMVQAWTDGGAASSTVPDFAPGDLDAWALGRRSRPAGPLRLMYHQAADGWSADEWYDGLSSIDVHYSSGPVNRMYYFLSAGAASDGSSVSYSAYLPEGMTGLGNDRAARIWYRTLTHYLVPTAGFAFARDASMAAAAELYGAGSPEQLAVRKAWAAVNVGAAPGRAARPRITLPVMNPPGTFIDDNVVPYGLLRRVQIYPTATEVVVKASVTDAADVSYRPVLGDGGPVAGTVTAGGLWRTPDFDFHGDFIALTARSNADPLEYAKTKALLLSMDCDTDAETDALDLGVVAMGWGLYSLPIPSASIVGGVEFAVDDWDLAFFNAGFSNAFPATR